MKSFFSNIYEFIRKVVHFFAPPREWRLVVIILLGLICGLGVYVLHISNAASYLSSDPKTCINCHVMVPQYATWKRSSHVRVTKCVDCHVPHDNVFHKYEFKMKDGIRHASIFTMRAEPQVIKIKPEGIAAVQKNCIRCHTNVLQDVSIHDTSYEDYLAGKGKLCWECHREVPHGRVKSLSATPFSHVPQQRSVVPDWLRDFLPVVEKSWFINDKEDNNGKNK